MTNADDEFCARALIGHSPERFYGLGVDAPMFLLYFSNSLQRAHISSRKLAVKRRM